MFKNIDLSQYVSSFIYILLTGLTYFCTFDKYYISSNVRGSSFMIAKLYNN